MRRLLVLAAFLVLHVPAQAQPPFSAAQLEALTAPIALYPDALLSSIFAASMHPADLIAAARAPGSDDPGWDPSVRALVPFPELLERMTEDPRWLADLGAAAYRQSFELSQAVQALRQRAYAGGSLASSDQLSVGISAGTILIQPAVPQVVYLPFYDPFVAYAPWRPSHPTARWRPWPTRRVFLREHEREERKHREAQRNPNGPPSPAAKMQGAQPQIGTRGSGPPSPARQLQDQQSQQFQQRQQQR